MKLEHYPVSKLKKEIADIVSQYLDTTVYHAFFFGSRVRGDNSERSDIDIGIEGPLPITGATRVKIEDDLEQLPTLYTFDVVDFAKKSPDFKEKALEYTEVIV